MTSSWGGSAGFGGVQEGAGDPDGGCPAQGRRTDVRRAVGAEPTREYSMRVRLLTAIGIASAVALHAQTPRVHELPLRPESVHWGYYDAKLVPALTVASGDRVRIETMVAGGLQRLRLAGVAEADIPESLKTVEQRVTERGPGAHPMTGPIYIEGAQSGDTLEIHIVTIEFLH